MHPLLCSVISDVGNKILFLTLGNSAFTCQLKYDSISRLISRWPHVHQALCWPPLGSMFPQMQMRVFYLKMIPIFLGGLVENIRVIQLANHHNRSLDESFIPNFKFVLQKRNSFKPGVKMSGGHVLRPLMRIILFLIMTEQSAMFYILPSTWFYVWSSSFYP